MNANPGNARVGRCICCGSICSRYSESGKCHECVKIGYQPTPQDIANETAEIRKGWSPERWKNQYGNIRRTEPREYHLPEIDQQDE